MKEDYATLESVASGWAIEQRARRLAGTPAGRDSLLLQMADGRPEQISTRMIGEAAAQRDAFAKSLLALPRVYLADAINQVITLLCPKRIVVGGGVALIEHGLWLKVIQQLVLNRVFAPFARSWEIVPAALGEEVVVHGAVALARRKLGERPR